MARDFSLKHQTDFGAPITLYSGCTGDVSLKIKHQDLVADHVPPSRADFE
jgi:hypothetical protein